jgi:hypothetical protein
VKRSQERSPNEWLADLTGLDPVVGLRAIDHIGANQETLAPLFGDIVVHRDFDLQLRHRMPLAFGKLGAAGVNTLVGILRSKDWWPMARAAGCCRYIRKPLAAERIAELIAANDYYFRIDDQVPENHSVSSTDTSTSISFVRG